MAWYLYWLLLGAILAISLALMVFNAIRRTVPGAPSLILMNGVVIIWGVIYLLELSAPDLEGKRFWDSFLFLSGLISAGLYIFSYRYLYPDRRLKPWLIAVFFVEPLITILLALTDGSHGLMRLNPHLVQVGWGSVIHYNLGFWVWIDSLYAMVLYILAVFQVTRSLLYAPRIYRLQASIILGGMSVPFLAALFFFSGLVPVYHGDLFIGLFFITNICLTWAVHTDRLENILPFARDSLFRSLTQGLIVVNWKHQIVEVNQAAEVFTGIQADQVVGRSLFSVFPGFHLPLYSKNEPYEQGDTLQDLQVNGRDLLATFSPVLNRSRDFHGWLILLTDFTESNNLRRELASSEEKYRSLADNALDGIVIVQDEKLVYCNQQAAGMVGLRQDEIQGEPYARFVPPALRDELSEYFRARQGMPVSSRLFETVLIRKDGLSVPVEININRVIYNRKAAVVGFIRDISQRKRTEQDLRRLETRLRNLVSYSPDGVLLLDEKGTIIEWNRAMEEITGLSQSDTIGRFYPDVIFTILPPEKRTAEYHEHMREHLVLALQTGEVGMLKAGYTEIVRKDGMRRITQQETFSIRTERGYQLGATSRDITEQRLAVENLARREAYLQAIFDNSLSMMWLKDPQGIYLAVNELHAQAAGRSVAEVLGRSDYDLWSPEVAEEFRAKDAEVIASGERIVYEELQPTQKGEIWVETVKSPIYDRAGNLIGTIGRAMDITARKRAEQELRESENRFRTMADTAPVMIWVADSDGGFSYLNRSWLAFTGRRIEEDLGAGWQSVVYPEDLPMLLNLFVLAEEAQRGFSAEFRLRRSDGEYRWMYGTAAPRLNPDGSLAGFIGSCLDITEQKERENQLKTFSMAVDQAPVSIIITDPEGRIEFVNAMFCQVTGYQFFEVLGKNPRILKSGETAPQEYCELWQTISSGGEWHGVFHNRKKTGELFWERASVFGITDARGEIIHYMAIKEDITVQREVENALREKSARLEAIFNNPQIGIGLVDTQNRYIQVNHRFAEMLGYTEAELLQRTPAHITHPEDLEKTRALNQALLSGAINQFYLEKRYQRKNGSVFWGSLTSMPIYEADGTIHSYVGFITDISERKAIEERLRTSEELYRSIIRASPDDITITDLTGRIRMVSPAAMRLFSYADEENFIGKNIGEFLVPEDYHRVMLPAVMELSRGETGRRIQVRGRRSHGELFSLEASMELMRASDGKPEAILFILRDVSEQLSLQAELRRRINELEALRATTADLAGELDLSRLLSAMIERVAALLGASEGEVALYDEKEDVLFEVISHNRDQNYSGVRMKMGEGAMGIAARELRTLIIPDYAEWEGRSQQFTPMHHSVIAVPLVVHDKLLGAITVGSPVGTRSFNERDARLCELFAQQAAIAIQNAKLFAEVQRLATLDPLTGVHNRRYFFDRAQQELNRSLRYGSDMAIILLDVDHFKSVNDRYGHPRGDDTLRVVAQLCREETRECDLVGRYGGEEFIILLPETSREGAQSMAERVCRRIEAERIGTPPDEIRITVSVGVAALEGRTSALESLLNQADQALYRAKEAGRNCVAC